METIKIAETIGARRKKLGLTQKELADKISVTDKAVSKWECGAGYPDITTLPDLAGALEVSVDALFGADNKSAREQNLHADQLSIWAFWKNPKCLYLVLVGLCTFICMMGYALTERFFANTSPIFMTMLYTSVFLCVILLPFGFAKKRKGLYSLLLLTLLIYPLTISLSVSIQNIWSANSVFIAVLVAVFFWLSYFLFHYISSNFYYSLAIITLLLPFLFQAIRVFANDYSLVIAPFFILLFPCVALSLLFFVIGLIKSHTNIRTVIQSVFHRIKGPLQ